MMFQIVIEFDSTQDPVRSKHGLRQLLEYAHWIKARETAPNIKPLAPVVWGCEEPIGFGLYEAENEQAVEEFLSQLHKTKNIRIIPCKYLDEVMQLAELRLASMERAEQSAQLG